MIYDMNGMDATPVLWHLEISHYNEKARWALDCKGVAHVRRAVTPGLQELTARRLRAGRTVPIVGESVCSRRSHRCSAKS